MRARKNALLSTTILSLAIGLGTVLSSCTNGGETNAVNSAQAQSSAANPCNPCAAANPCNPCAAANPCNPCAAVNPCNPCAAANPCNPCAAANPCNPCAAANPCAAVNPCNPCAAANPCAAKQVAAAGPSADDLKKLYADLESALKEGYIKSGNPAAPEYQSWAIFNTQPYVSQTHGKRYVNNYANDVAKAAYAKFEKIGKMPSGGVVAKDSFVIGKDGKTQPGPLFLMEKMEAGFNPTSDDWRYTLIMPNGTVFGTTKGAGTGKVEFCVQCHKAVADQDSLYFVDEEYRTAP